MQFPTQTDKSKLETTDLLAPRFDDRGLITAVAVDVRSREVLMLAHMNQEALAATLDTGIAHYWSRSRAQLWKKGETSGNLQQVHDIRIDCDQDAIVLLVEVAGDGISCHTGARSCFYRSLVTGSDGVKLVHTNP